MVAAAAAEVVVVVVVLAAINSGREIKWKGSPGFLPFPEELLLLSVKIRERELMHTLRQIYTYTH